MDSLRKKKYKKFKNGVKVKFPEEELPIFRSFMEQTSESKEFSDRDDQFYYNRFKYYKDRVLVPLAYLKFDEYIEELTNERQTLERFRQKHLKTLRNDQITKAYNKRDNLQQQLDANQQKLNEANQLQANTVMSYLSLPVSLLLIRLKLYTTLEVPLINIVILQVVTRFSGL